MKHTWCLPRGPLAVAAVLILTGLSLAYAQDAGVVINGTVSTGAGTSLRVSLDPKEDPPPKDPCEGGLAKALHVVRMGPNGERMDDCQPLKPEHLTTPVRSGRKLPINSKGITPADKTSELHADLLIVNTTRAPIILGKPVIRHSPAITVSIGSGDHLPPIPPPHIPCYIFRGPPPWVLQPGGSVYCGLEVSLPLVTPAVIQTFSVQFPVLPR